MANKKFYTKKLGRRVATNARRIDSNRYHVILSDGQKWAVVADGNVKASRVFPDQLKAINFAREAATKLNGEVVVHKRTGEIEDLVSFAK